MFDKLGWTPEFYIGVNEYVIKQSVDEIRRIDALKFLPRWAARHVGADDRTMFFRPLRRWRFLRGFSTDLLYGWCPGSTVTNCALQLSYYLGFAEVVLIGVDHHYSAKGPPHKLIKSKGPDHDHFSPEYFGRGVKWQLPDLVGSEYSYRIARAIYEEAGRRIVDATVGGQLEVFPKVDYDSLL